MPVKKKILIVDDERSLLESLEMFFSEKGYEVACAATAAEAIAENEDSMMPLETPEVVSDGLQVMNEQLGVPLSAVARQMGVQPRLLDDLLGKATESSDTNVVNLFR